MKMTPPCYVSAAMQPKSGHYNGTSQPQYKVQANAMYQRAYGYQMHRRGSHGYATHQSGDDGVPACQPNSCHPQNNDAAIQKTNFRSYRKEIVTKFRGINGLSRRDARATRDLFSEEDSLYPHGLSFAEDYLNEWDQRPECPRPKWICPENTSWQSHLTSSSAGEYSGTELILANEGTAPKVSRIGLINLYTNLRPWQISLSDSDSQVSAESAVEDYSKSDSSDSSSVKSYSSIDFFSS